MSTSKELPHTLKIWTVWLLILLAVFLAMQAWEHQRQQKRITVNDGQIILQRGPDGHFRWPGQVNGHAVDFLVDTGATGTALPESLARQAGLVREGTISSNTAGGVVQGWRARADVALQGGVKAQRLPVTVLPQLDAPLLGMDVLARLHFIQQGGELRIEAGGPR